MVEPNTVPLFLLLPFSLNCQLDLITIKVPLLLSLAGTLGLFTTQVLHVFPSQLPCRDVLSADPFSMYLQLPSHMPDTLAPSRMGPGTGTPLEVLPQVQPAAQDTLPPIPRNTCATGGWHVGSAAGGTSKPITVNKSSNQAQSFASMKSHFLSSAKYCVKILFSLKTLSLS